MVRLGGAGQGVVAAGGDVVGSVSDPGRGPQPGGQLGLFQHDAPVVVDQERLGQEGALRFELRRVSCVGGVRPTGV